MIIFYLAATIRVTMDGAIFVATKRVAIDVAMSRPDPRSDPIGGSEPSSGCETQD